MKQLRYEIDGETRIGILEGDEIRRLDATDMITAAISPQPQGDARHVG